MPDFKKGPNYRAPFGANVFLRSTQDVKTESFTLSAATVPAVTIDGFDGQKVLQKGTVLAKVTSGDEVGKVGPFDPTATDGRQTPANIVGLNNTFLPWQLMERDVEVAAVVECRAVQGWCLEYVDEGVWNGGAGGGVANGNLITVPLSDATANEMVGQKHLSIMFS